MGAPAIPSKTELLKALRESGERAVTSLRALNEETFEAGGYENGWNARQILAHIASIEWTYPKLLEVAREALAQPSPPAPAPAEVRRTTPAESPGMATRTASGGIDSYNERHVQKREQTPAAELIEEFARNRAATIAAVESADEALLAAPIRSAGGITGALASVLRAVAVQHVDMHVSDICGEEHGGPRW